MLGYFYMEITFCNYISFEFLMFTELQCTDTLEWSEIKYQTTRVNQKNKENMGKFSTIRNEAKLYDYVRFKLHRK